MRPNTILIDEAGCFGHSPSSSKYFIGCATLISDTKPFDKIIRNFRRNKLPKKYKNQPEIKYHPSTDANQRYILSKISACDCTFNYSATLKDDSSIPSYQIYSETLLSAVEPFFNDINVNTRVIVDYQSDLKLRSSFKNGLIEALESAGCPVPNYIDFIISQANLALQAHDFVTGATYKLIEYKDDDHYSIIKRLKYEKMGGIALPD